MLDRRTILLSAVGAGTLVQAAAGRSGGQQEPRPSQLSKYFARPSGRNGLEDFLAAVDVLQTSKPYREMQAASLPGTISLTLKRRILSDLPVTRALALIQRGLTKPYALPVSAGQGENVIGVNAPMRELARLLALRQYVLFADGRVPDAIGTARVTMRLGQVVQAGPLISGLVGIAIGAIGMRTLGRNLEQLSARDCELLSQICGEWLSQPSPLLRVFEEERRAGLKSLAEMGNQKPEPPTPEELAMLTPEERRALANLTPEKLAAFQLEIRKEFNAHWDRVLADTRKPFWEREFPTDAPPDESVSPANVARALTAMLVPVFKQAQQRYAQEEAMVRLLAVHAAVLRYRWEWDKPPPDLATLNLGDLVLDPFTGQQMKYQVNGRRYQLNSVGPPAEADDPKAVDGRKPVTVGD